MNLNPIETIFFEMARKGVDIVLKSIIYGIFRIVPIVTTGSVEALDDYEPNRFGSRGNERLHKS